MRSRFLHKWENDKAIVPTPLTFLHSDFLTLPFIFLWNKKWVEVLMSKSCPLIIDSYHFKALKWKCIGSENCCVKVSVYVIFTRKMCHFFLETACRTLISISKHVFSSYLVTKYWSECTCMSTFYNMKISVVHTLSVECYKCSWVAHFKVLFGPPKNFFDTQCEEDYKLIPKVRPKFISKWKFSFLKLCASRP